MVLNWETMEYTATNMLIWGMNHVELSGARGIVLFDPVLATDCSYKLPGMSLPKCLLRWFVWRDVSGAMFAFGFVQKMGILELRIVAILIEFAK